MPDDKATSQIPALTIRTVFIATHVMLLARRSVIRSYPIPTEDGGHRGGGASDKHRLSFCRTHVGKLGKKRPLGSAGHFDRTKQVRPRQFPGGLARWPKAASDIKVEGLDGKLFLVRANGDAIFHLYPVAVLFPGCLLSRSAKLRLRNSFMRHFRTPIGDACDAIFAFSLRIEGVRSAPSAGQGCAPLGRVYESVKQAVERAPRPFGGNSPTFTVDHARSSLPVSRVLPPA